MRRKDYMILFVLFVLAIMSVIMFTNLIDAGLAMASASVDTTLGTEAAYPGPGPYAVPIGTNLLPLIFKIGN